MNPADPVDVAAMRMFAETSDYLLALKHGETPDPTEMSEATQAYGQALKASLEREIAVSQEAGGEG